LRCGISLKGADIVVGGNVGSFSAFMAQAGRIVICGDAGDALGDSLYEAVIYVRGKVRSLGADARFEPMAERIYDIRGLGAKRRSRISTTCCFSGARCRAIRWRAIARNARPTSARHALRQEADRAEDPDHHRRHELRRAVGARPRRRSAAAPPRSAPRPPPATAA
jgi:hypothetical protein